MRFRAQLALLLVPALAAVGCARADAQQSVVIRDAGPGPVGRRLTASLAAPRRLIPPARDSAAAQLPRDSAYATTVIILARDAIIEGRVHGDVYVVGGNAFVHPGASVDGRVIAIGGGAYGSMLGLVRDTLESHRDFTFDVTHVAGSYTLDFRVVRRNPSPILSLPALYGVRLPTYNRSDGLSLPFAPLVSLDTGRYELQPTITYRSDIGAIDPSLSARLELSRVTRIDLFAGRTTLTNDAWIWSDIVNSAAAVALGIDTRNYFRADRAEAAVHRLWQAPTMTIAPFVGARVERDWAIGPDSAASAAPWSLFGRNSRERMLRPNPPAVRGSFRSLLVGANWSWEAQRVRSTLNVLNEGALFSAGERRFVQSTFDGEVRFPTFGSQEFWASAHAIHTFGDSTPPQRWSYIGGAGTISTLELLEMGGDRLLFIESNYFIPIQRLDFRILGAPSITLRHLIGSAGVHRLPAFRQNIGLRLALSLARAEVDVDPADGNANLGFGLSFTR